MNNDSLAGVHITGESRFPAFTEMLNTTIPEWNVIERCVKADITHFAPTSADSKDDVVYAPYPGHSTTTFSDYIHPFSARIATSLPRRHSRSMSRRARGQRA